MPGCSALHHTSLHPVDKTAPRSSPTVRSADTCKPSTNPGRGSDTSQPSTHAQKLQPSNNLQNSRRSQQPNRTKSPHFNATAMNNDNSKLPTDLLSVLQVIPVSIMNGKRIVDTYALIDPGSTGTYIVETIAKSIDLKTDRKFNMNVQFLSASKSLPVSRTNFTIAPNADNERHFWFRMHSVPTKSVSPQLTSTNLTPFANPHLTCDTSSSRISITDTLEFYSELPV